MCEVCRMTPCSPRCPNAPEPRGVYKCKDCGEDILEGDNFFEYDGDYYHEECFRECAVDILLNNGASYGIAEGDYND